MVQALARDGSAWQASAAAAAAAAAAAEAAAAAVIVYCLSAGPQRPTPLTSRPTHRVHRQSPAANACLQARHARRVLCSSCNLKGTPRANSSSITLVRPTCMRMVQRCHGPKAQQLHLLHDQPILAAAAIQPCGCCGGGCRRCCRRRPHTKGGGRTRLTARWVRHQVGGAGR